MAKTKKPSGSKRPRPEPLEENPEKKSVKKPEKKTAEKRPLPELPLTENEKKAQDPSSTKSSQESSRPGIEEEEEILLDQQDILQICKEVPDLGFQIWKRFDPEIELLSEGVKNRIAQPLARIVYRKNFDKWVKDEFYLVFLLGLEVSKRIKIKKKNVKDNSGEKGTGKDHPSL